MRSGAISRARSNAMVAIRAAPRRGSSALAGLWSKMLHRRAKPGGKPSLTALGAFGASGFKIPRRKSGVGVGSGGVQHLASGFKAPDHQGCAAHIPKKQGDEIDIVVALHRADTSRANIPKIRRFSVCKPKQALGAGTPCASCPAVLDVCSPRSSSACDGLGQRRAARPCRIDTRS